MYLSRYEKNVIGVESCKRSRFDTDFIFSKLYAVMVGIGGPLMQDIRVHGPFHDTGEQHGGQSSQLDLLINGRCRPFGISAING